MVWPLQLAPCSGRKPVLHAVLTQLGWQLLAALFLVRRWNDLAVGWPDGEVLPAKEQLTQGGSSRAAFGSQASSAVKRAGFFIEFTATHLLFDATSLDQFAEPPHRFLNALPVSNHQFYHTDSLFLIFCFVSSKAHHINSATILCLACLAT